MNLLHDAVRIAICGVTSTGKSTCAERIAASYLLKGRRVFIYDHQAGEFAQRLGKQPISSFDGLREALQRNDKIFCFDPYEEFGGDAEAGFLFFCEWVWEICGADDSPSLFVIDEIHMMVGNSILKPEIKDVVVAGRRRGIDLLYILQGMNMAHNIMRQNLTECFFFRQVDALALDWPKAQGIPVNDLMRLETGEFIHFNLRTRKLSKSHLFKKKQVDTRVLLDDSNNNPKVEPRNVTSVEDDVSETDEPEEE